MEKAHPGVQDVFYQVFDKGNMKDGEGRDIDFKNTVVLMTSNAATDTIMKKRLCGSRNDAGRRRGLRALHSTGVASLKFFKPAFLGRITVIPYFPLSDKIMRQIAVLKLGEKIANRIREHYDASFTWSDAVLDHIVSRCTEVDSGARNVDKILTGTMLPQLSTEFLAKMAEGATVKAVEVTVDDESGGFRFSLA